MRTARPSFFKALRTTALCLRGICFRSSASSANSCAKESGVSPIPSVKAITETNKGNGSEDEDSMEVVNRSYSSEKDVSMTEENVEEQPGGGEEDEEEEDEEGGAAKTKKTTTNEGLDLLHDAIVSQSQGRYQSKNVSRARGNLVDDMGVASTQADLGSCGPNCEHASMNKTDLMDSFSHILDTPGSAGHAIVNYLGRISKLLLHIIDSSLPFQIGCTSIL